MRIGRARLTAGLDRFERIDLTTHQEIFGPMRRVTARQLIEMVESVDLRGRGGAAFPFARKVRAVVDNAASRKLRPVVLVNGTEGEPGSAKDKMLLLRSPYLVLGGALLTARALSAREIVIGVTGGGRVAKSIVAAAKAEPDLRKILRIVEVPDRFVSGEGGALVNAVNGKVALPPGRKRRASDMGVDQLPTYLSNAETFAQLAVLAMLGTEGYASDGTAEEPGTVLLTVGGSAGRPAVVEVPIGVPLGNVLDICEATAHKGVLVGGYHGMWLPAEIADEVPVSRAGLDAAGGALGAGIVLPLGAGTCPLGEVARIVRYLAKESSGQCGPCKLGLPGIARSMSAAAEPARTRTARPGSSSRLSTCSPTTSRRTCSAAHAGSRSAGSCRSRPKMARRASRWTGHGARDTGSAGVWCRNWSRSTTRATRCSWICRCHSGWRRRPSKRLRCAPPWPSGSARCHRPKLPRAPARRCPAPGRAPSSSSFRRESSPPVPDGLQRPVPRRRSVGWSHRTFAGGREGPSWIPGVTLRLHACCSYPSGSTPPAAGRNPIRSAWSRFPRTTTGVRRHSDRLSTSASATT